MEVQPLVEELGEYPFTALDDARQAALDAGRPLIDFGVGAPAEPVPGVVKRALLDAVDAEEVSRYPSAAGTKELREAIAAWISRRYGVDVDPAVEVLPTLGSKEPIYHLAGLLHWNGSHRDLVVVTTPGYPVPARAARLAGAQVVELPLDFYEELAARCRRHGIVLASDEAYSEIWAGPEPPPSVLQVSDPTHVLAFHSLSKRSAIPGYRSGFVAGDPLLVGAMRTLRPTMGVAPPLFVQKASVAAWSDEAHVEELRERFRAKREVMLPALEHYGLPSVGGDAGFFLWCEAPGGDDRAAFEQLREAGILAAPGSMLGAGGEGYVRFALVPGLDECVTAAAILDGGGR